MKFAPIIPTPNLHQFQSTGINMLLAQQLEDPRYLRHYQRRFFARDFNILDNGAHEGETFTFQQMLVKSVGIANEVVIPDVPHNTRETLRLFRQTLEYLDTQEGRRLYEDCKSPRLMMVPQVPLEGEWLYNFVSFAHSMIEACVMGTWLDASQFTIAVPLMYDTDPNVSLVDVVDRIADQCDRNNIPIHLLGWSRNMMTPINVAKRFPSLVRSVDSAKPFVHGRYGVQYSTETGINLISTIYPGRPSDYFERALTLREAYIGNFNSNVLQSLIFDAELPELSELSDDMSAEDWEATHSIGFGLPDSARSKEGDTTRR